MKKINIFFFATDKKRKTQILPIEKSMKTSKFESISSFGSDDNFGFYFPLHIRDRNFRLRNFRRRKTRRGKFCRKKISP